MEDVLSGTPSYPAQLTQLKRGMRTLAAGQAEWSMTVDDAHVRCI